MTNFLRQLLYRLLDRYDAWLCRMSREIGGDE